MTEMKPCPFCGSDDVYLGMVSDWDGTGSCFCCGCSSCDLRTPLFETDVEAAEFWKRWEFNNESRSD